MSSTFYSSADDINNNIISISECKDNSQGINDDRKILTINLDSVSKCLKGRNINVELQHNNIQPKEETDFEQSSWSQTQLKPNNCEKTTIQITNVISLASEISDQFINGPLIFTLDNDLKAESELFIHNEKKEFQVPTFNKKSYSHMSSSEELGNINEETTNADFNDIYITEEERIAHNEKQRPFSPESSFKVEASKEQRGSCNLQFCPTNLDYLYKESSLKPDGEQGFQYETDQYKNIEFSAIFSSLEDYDYYQEDSFDESIIPSHEPLNWGHNYTESQNNLIIDLDNQKEMPTCDESPKSEKIICRDIHKDCEIDPYTMDSEEILEKNSSLKSDSGDLEWQNYVYSNLSEATEPSLHYIGYKKWPHPQHSPQFLKLPSYGAATDITDDEETDDADEIDNLSVTFSLSNSDTKSIIPLSPRSLTSSPLSTSTPVSSISQESQAPEDLNTCCPYPVALTCLNNPNVQGKSLIMPQCKLESTLFSFGTEHGVKLPYPSMADVMRRNRLAARSVYLKKSENVTSDPAPRRCGRPRKNQIQSAKITTSTSKTTKAKVKTSLKLKGCCPEILQADADNSNDYEEAGSSGSNYRNSRHNEPLNQKAVYIMSKWYTENINNPYPSKADKEEMAQQGGITENQVKSWFANKRNRTNNTKPKVQKRVMEQKLRELFKDLKHNSGNPSADNAHIIQQLSGILQQCHAKQAE
ncbi:hypothetical protein Btru_074248 [Bulinus truncatus]|nr:hypothetical protein Btru_074248 [Bulinus truncatus]